MHVCPCAHARAHGLTHPWVRAHQLSRGRRLHRDIVIEEQRRARGGLVERSWHPIPIVGAILRVEANAGRAHAAAAARCASHAVAVTATAAADGARLAKCPSARRPAPPTIGSVVPHDEHIGHDWQCTQRSQLLAEEGRALGRVASDHDAHTRPLSCALLSSQPRCPCSAGSA